MKQGCRQTGLAIMYMEVSGEILIANGASQGGGEKKKKKEIGFSTEMEKHLQKKQRRGKGSVEGPWSSGPAQKASGHRQAKVVSALHGAAM